jgi:FlaA1/EpsC-like NDP-sugar epimerase
MTRSRRVGLLLLDVVVVAGAISLSFWLRFDYTIPARYLDALLWSLPLVVLAKLLTLTVSRVYRHSWRHAGVREFATVGIACAVGSAVLAAAVFGLRGTAAFASFPRSVLGVDFAFCLIGIGGVRLLGRVIGQGIGRSPQRQVGTRNTLVIGAGDAGAQLVRAMREEQGFPYRIVGLVDDDPSRHGMLVRGIRVLGPRRRIPQLVRQWEIESVLIALPSVSPVVVRETIEIVRKTGVREIKIIPHLSELYSGEAASSELRELRPEDLLRREPIRIEGESVRGFLEGKVVLVTGAAGSIGSELCRQVLAFGAARIVALDFDETGLFDLEADLSRRFPGRRIDVAVCDVRDRGSLARAFDRFAPQVVYHAAAYKHVPMMEAYPAEAAKVNVMGTRNALEQACRVECEAFVLISTDKAVNPTSVMGATKRVAEIVVQGWSESRPRCIAVRFGNVLGSRGSVLRTFQSQVERRLPVTITDPGMRRYFMVTSEAVQLVLQASVFGETGDVLVLDMGEPIGIVDLAHDVIRFYGYEPDVDIPIVFTGPRPGEKLYEDLFTEDEGRDATSHERVFVARLRRPTDMWAEGLSALEEGALAGDDGRVIEALRCLVPEYLGTSSAEEAPRESYSVS